MIRGATKLRASKLGFTLVEVILVVAITTFVVGIGAPVYGSFVRDNDLNVATNVIIQNLYRAQSKSRSGENDSQWGIAVDNNSHSITLFAGPTYGSRNTSLDTTFTTNSSITFSGLSGVVYSKVSGLPQSTGSITLTSGNKSKVVSWNGKGTVEY